MQQGIRVCGRGESGGGRRAGCQYDWVAEQHMLLHMNTLVLNRRQPVRPHLPRGEVTVSSTEVCLAFALGPSTSSSTSPSATTTTTTNAIATNSNSNDASSSSSSSTTAAGVAGLAPGLEDASGLRRPEQQPVFAFLPLRSYGLRFVVQVRPRGRGETCSAAWTAQPAAPCEPCLTRPLFHLSHLSYSHCCGDAGMRTGPPLYHFTHTIPTYPLFSPLPGRLGCPLLLHTRLSSHHFSPTPRLAHTIPWLLCQYP